MTVKQVIYSLVVGNTIGIYYSSGIDLDGDVTKENLYLLHYLLQGIYVLFQ